MLHWPHISALVAYNRGTSVGHGPVRTLFLSLVLFHVPMTPCETMLYWRYISALVIYNGGTSIGHGPVKARLPEPDFVSSVGTLDIGHGDVTSLLLSLVVSLVPMTPSETMLVWSHISALVASNGGSSVGHGPVKTIFLEPNYVSSVGTLDVGHAPVRTLSLSLVLCLIPVTPVKLCHIGPTSVPWWPTMVAVALALVL